MLRCRLQKRASLSRWGRFRFDWKKLFTLYLHLNRVLCLVYGKTCPTRLRITWQRYVQPVTLVVELPTSVPWDTLLVRVVWSIAFRWTTELRMIRDVCFCIFRYGGQSAMPGPEQDGSTCWPDEGRELTIVHICFSGKRNWHMVYTASFRSDVVL